MKYRRSDFKEESTPGDGSCMYHSCSYYLNENANIIRKRVANFIQTNGEYKINDLTLKEWLKHGENMSIDEYTKRTGQNGTWGGATELKFISIIYKVNIKILKGADLRCYKVVADIPHQGVDEYDTMYLYWSGSHYTHLQVTE